MELLSIEYGDWLDLYDGEDWNGEQETCLKMILSLDPALFARGQASARLVQVLGLFFPSVARGQPIEPDVNGELWTVAYLTGSFVLDLERDLCAWPGGQCFRCRSLKSNYEFELYVECADERVGRFSGQLAVEVVRMLLLDEPFDPRLIWVIDLVRRLYRQPRLRLSGKRIASVLGCSRESAQWAIQGLERYGYLRVTDVRHPRRPTGRRILIIDDSAQIRDLLSRMLELLGYDVITAVDGEEGLILLSWADYAAIFVDMMMPCLDGTSFVQRARKEGAACPIFVISSYHARSSAKEIRDIGATGFVRKPFSTAEIEGLLNRYLKYK